MIKKFMSRQFFLFLLTGGLAALVNFASRIGYSQFVVYSTAIVLAYITGMITAFTLARLFVFKESRQIVPQSAYYFVLVNVVAVAQTWLISLWLAYYALPYLGVQHFVPEIAHAIGLAVPIFSSYIGHKKLSFK
ncbi:MAG: GtrA family protein [Chlorobium sp.]|nr:MAG: GtrA family protein [Chlorobium sp.]